MKKSIIIDFDNTIGYFSQIIYLINIIEKTYHRKMNQEDVNILLDIYTLSFRPKIFEILKFISELKEKNIIQNLILYTKNKNETFVKMVLSFIEEQISITTVGNEKSPPLFDHIVFSKTKTKYLEPLMKIQNIFDKVETQICFIDNKNYKYETQNSRITIYFIECDTYKFYYTQDEIIKKMNYKVYSKLSKKLIYKYLKSIYKNKTTTQNIPIKIHEFNSLYIFNLLNNFCFLTK